MAHFVDPEHPFRPATSSLRELLAESYIPHVVRWLLGKNNNSVLAHDSGSAWETALSVQVFADALEILPAERADPLRSEVSLKSCAAARWLLSVKNTSADGLANWENVTWDTSVVIRALVTVLKDSSAQFSEKEIAGLRDAVVKGTRWLLQRFAKWETEVKYPFGPADVSQIVITLIFLAKTFPELYAEAITAYRESKAGQDPAADIIRELLHKKTKRLLAPVVAEAEAVTTYWCDDYFSTAEVVEALATYYELSVDSTLAVDTDLLKEIKEALVGVCMFFELTQCDGMWGSHIDTLKVVHCYVFLRRRVLHGSPPSPLLVPEIHTTFKAIRWMCDPKQIFSDGSFLHTMFLTIFYSRALLEVYRSWEPANRSIERIYDDVVWFSPVRTTPERGKRLAVEIENVRLRGEAAEQCARLEARVEAERTRRQQLWRRLVAGVLAFAATTVIAAIAVLVGALVISVKVPKADLFIALLAILVPLAMGASAIVLKDLLRLKDKDTPP